MKGYRDEGTDRGMREIRGGAHMVASRSHSAVLRGGGLGPVCRRVAGHGEDSLGARCGRPPDVSRVAEASVNVRCRALLSCVPVNVRCLVLLSCVRIAG